MCVCSPEFMLKMYCLAATCQVPGVTGLVIGLVGLVSVHCDWTRQ